MMVVWYALRCTAYVLAQWGGLLVVKLSPMRYYEMEEEHVSMSNNRAHEVDDDDDARGEETKKER